MKILKEESALTTIKANLKNSLDQINRDEQYKQQTEKELKNLFKEFQKWRKNYNKNNEIESDAEDLISSLFSRFAWEGYDFH